MPSVLVETGFLTNKSEGQYLNSTKGKTEMGKAIADAVLAYKKDVEVMLNKVDNTTSIPNESPAKSSEVTVVSSPSSVKTVEETAVTSIGSKVINQEDLSLDGIETTNNNDNAVLNDVVFRCKYL